MLRNLAIQYFSKVKEALRKRYFIVLFTLPYVLDLFGDFIFSKALPNETSLVLEFSLLFVTIFLIDIIYQKANRVVKAHFSLNLDLVIFPSIIIFLYSYIIDFLLEYLNKLTFKIFEINHYYAFLLIWILNYLLFKYVFNQFALTKIINLILVVICLAFILKSILNSKKATELSTTKQNQIYLNSAKSNTNNTVVLIILDEYESPNELYNITKDSSVFELSNFLKKNNWTLNNNSFSQNLITVNSISSIFNYNFKQLDKELLFRFSLNKLDNSELISDLKTKKVKVINYGIFNLGNQKALIPIYFNLFATETIQTNFIKAFFTKTILSNLLNNIYNENDKQISHNSYLAENIHKLVSPANKNTLYYFHLLMPHFPYNYKSKRYIYHSPLKLNGLDSYVNYYKFTNKLIIKQLQQLKYMTKYKIIITGDHGYREIPDKISPKLTSTYYFGYNIDQTSKIKSVQDIGSLIYASF